MRRSGRGIAVRAARDAAMALLSVEDFLLLALMPLRLSSRNRTVD
jgi:hypothetical protein